MRGEGPSDLVPSDVVMTLPQNTRGIELSKIEDRLDLIREASAVIPRNEFNLPVYIYRSDLLHMEQLSQLDAMLESATIFLQYHHGFPTLKGESPFWARLDWEDSSAFQAFLEYLSLPGGRILRNVQGYAPDLLQKWYHEYFWAPRALAYDMYQAAHHARLRENRIFKVENQHWEKSEKLFERISTQLESADLKDIEPEKLVKMMATVAQIQRGAAGLSPIGSKGEDSLPKATSVEVSMRKISEQHGVPQIVEENMDLSSIYNDADALKVVQDIVIKVTK